jgi:FkbM family methyltransferase
MKSIFKQLLRSIGYDIHRYNPSSSVGYQLEQTLRNFKIDLVFDIGSNVGQFAKNLREVGYNDRIVSFEPLIDAHHALSKVARGSKGWDVHERCAIGDVNGTIQINVSTNSVSSSVLPMLKEHSDAAPESVFTRSEEAPIYTLDSVSDRYMTSRNSTLIKIDTQGFEWQVLDGASETLKCARGVMIELSLVPLYSRQRLWRDIIARLEKQGFVLWSLNPAFVDPRDGRTLQVDGVFFRK